MRITAHLATPAPVAARLFAGDLPLFAERAGDALAGEEECGADADDAAADDDDVRGGGDGRVARDDFEGWGHSAYGRGSGKRCRNAAKRPNGLAAKRAAARLGRVHDQLISDATSS